MADARPDFDDNARPIVDGVVTVSTTPTKLCISTSLNELTEYIFIENIGNASATLGRSSITFGNGLTLYKKDRHSLSCTTGNEWYAVVNSGTIDVYIMEMGS